MSLLTITGSIVDNHPQFDLHSVFFDQLIEKGSISLTLQHLQLYYIGNVIRINEHLSCHRHYRPRVCYVSISYSAYLGTMTENLTTSLFIFNLI